MIFQIVFILITFVKEKHYKNVQPIRAVEGVTTLNIGVTSVHCSGQL